MGISGGDDCPVVLELEKLVACGSEVKSRDNRKLQLRNIRPDFGRNRSLGNAENPNKGLVRDPLQSCMISKTMSLCQASLA